MVFANLLFIYLFLPLNLLFYFLSKQIAYRNAVMICFSFLFRSEEHTSELQSQR